MKGISVIICCYNSALRLPETLKHLANQKVFNNINWEIILVNNNSSDNTVDVAKKEWSKYSSEIPFTIVDELNAGLNNAREKGINHALYEFLLFCDDDNWLFDNYIEKAYYIMANNSEIGVLGGHGIPKTEIEPEPWINLSIYATGPQSAQSGDVTETRTTVYGAGSVFRKSALVHLKEKGFKSFLSDRKGDVLTSGGDAELCWALSLSGFKIWYEEDLKFYHFLPKNRLQLSYLKKLEYGNGYSCALHLPYYHYITKSKRSKIKNLWWWRILGLLSILARDFHFIRRKNDTDPLTVLSNERQKGLLAGLWKERSTYTLLFKTLAKADWIKNKATSHS